MSQVLSVEQLKNAVPKSLKTAVTQGLVDTLNQFGTDPAFAEHYRNNLISYASVLNNGKFKVSDYLCAVRYVSFKLMGYTNKDAYINTFPEKYDYFLQQGKGDKAISSFVAAYSSNKLVTLIQEQALIPAYVAHQDLFNKALLVQAELMQTASSEKVRSDAANSLLSHLKQPEKSKVELEVKTESGSVVEELREATARLVAQQKLAIQSGQQTAEQVAHSRIIEGEKVSD